MKLRAVGFDYGGVIKGVPGSVFGKNMSALLGVSEDEYYKAYFTHNKKVNRGEVSWRELWTLVFADLGKTKLVDEALKLSNDPIYHKMNTEVIELADRLRKNGYKTGLLSNNTRDNAQIMRQEGIEKHFDAFHVSAETGFVKPEPKAFDYLAKDLGIEVSELVFIDDSTTSLSTAEEVGFTPMLFTSYEQLLTQLQELGIKTA